MFERTIIMKSILIATALAFLCICGTHYLTALIGIKFLHGSVVEMILSAFSGTCSVLLAQKV
jgi:hypothetical protein